MQICEDCQNTFHESEGRYYKYDPSIWLCDDCELDRIEEE